MNEKERNKAIRLGERLQEGEGSSAGTVAQQLKRIEDRRASYRNAPNLIKVTQVHSPTTSIREYKITEELKKIKKEESRKPWSMNKTQDITDLNKVRKERGLKPISDFTSRNYRPSLMSDAFSRNMTDDYVNVDDLEQTKKGEVIIPIAVKIPDKNIVEVTKTLAKEQKLQDALDKSKDLQEKLAKEKQKVENIKKTAEIFKERGITVYDKDYNPTKVEPKKDTTLQKVKNVITDVRTSAQQVADSWDREKERKIRNETALLLYQKEKATLQAQIAKKQQQTAFAQKSSAGYTNVQTRSPFAGNTDKGLAYMGQMKAGPIGQGLPQTDVQGMYTASVPGYGFEERSGSSGSMSLSAPSSRLGPQPMAMRPSSMPIQQAYGKPQQNYGPQPMAMRPSNVPIQQAQQVSPITGRPKRPYQKTDKYSYIKNESYKPRIQYRYVPKVVTDEQGRQIVIGKTQIAKKPRHPDLFYRKAVTTL
jgi:hypothetical protein